MAVQKSPKYTAKELAARKAVKAAKATPAQGSVKVIPPTEASIRKLRNDVSDSIKANAKSGLRAAVGAGLQEAKNMVDAQAGKKTKVVQVNSATTKRQGTTPAPSIRRAGGLMGGGGAGNWRNLFK